MIRAEDYAIEINADEAGVVVSVRHKITGSTREARPSATESVGAVRSRLIAQIEAEFFDPAEFVIDTGHSRVDGRARDWMRVTHRPSGISRNMPTPAGGSRRQVMDELISEILTELWQRANGAAEL